MTVKPSKNVKQLFFERMGWCECNSCGSHFTVWEDYVEHVCTQGIPMTQQQFRWDISE
jgi:hypothetical protein